MLSRKEQGVVVFKIWPSLPYGWRQVMAFGLIAAGLLLQLLLMHPLPGILAVLAGNLFLLVRGYDNRITPGRFDPSAEWEEVEPSRLDDIEELNRAMKKWDRSALDASNGCGGTIFVVLVAAMGVLFLLGVEDGNMVFIMVALNAYVLLIPHWFSGIRSILTTPKLLVKIKTIKDVLERAQQQLQGLTIRYYMLLKGGETKLPSDVKIRVDLPDKPPEFLGLYGQVVTNDVKGSSYPYFYTVLVARKGFGLEKLYDNYTPPAGITAEYKEQQDVEVFVVRQHTTRTSGYHTNTKAAAGILDQGLALTRAAVQGKA